LLAIKDIHTSSLGLIMEDWHSFPTDSATVAEAESNLPKGQWQGSVSRTVALTEAILHHAVSPSTAPDFEQNVFAAIENSTIRLQAQDHDSSTTENPLQLIQRLIHVLRTQLPSHTTSVSTKIKRNGRPRAIIRYWLPLSIVLFSGSASLNFILHRKDDILQWIMDFGSTVIDFAQNWVVAPVHKLIGTIRHDEKSEIAIMSKNSLVADRDSLERMVLDFVRDRPESSQAMTPEDATLITNAVKEGDLTPVLRAYERDLRSPFKGTVRGDLVRALLIQIQKTKVDVEVAISGINALLKSQELVFG
jgi:nuclear-control-of-ATPase protein 2